MRRAFWLSLGLLFCLLGQPELYVRSLKSKRPELSTILGQLEKSPPLGKWSCEQQSYTAEMMSQVSALFAEKNLLEKIADAWQEGRFLVWTNGGRQVALSLVRFQTPGAARAYQAMVLDIQRKREEIIRGAMRSVPLHVKFVQLLTSPALEEGVQNALKPSTFDSNPIILTSAPVKDCVLAFTWIGLDPDPTWAERIVSSFLANDS